MSTKIEASGLLSVAYASTDNIIALTSDPNSNLMSRIEFAPGTNWVELPILPESAHYQMNLQNNPDADIYYHQVALKLNEHLEEVFQSVDALRRGWYILKMEDSHNREFIIGNLFTPGKFYSNVITIGPDQSTNVENGLSFICTCSQNAIKVV